MLVELSVMEQRYHAVMEVVSGAPVTEVARRYGVSRQAVHGWLSRYEHDGLAGLADHSHRPAHQPRQLDAEIEALICQLRGAHPRWGPRRLLFELGKAKVSPLPSRSTVYRVLVRHGLVPARKRKRRRQDYKRWQREEPMQLWQLDVTGSVFLAEGTELKLISGIDDHSRFCVIATVVRRATARAVCRAFLGAMRLYGIPDEVLTDIQDGLCPGMPCIVRPVVRGFLASGACPSSLLTDRSVREHGFLPVDHEAGRGIAEDGSSC
jgi:transposase